MNEFALHFPNSSISMQFNHFTDYQIDSIERNEFQASLLICHIFFKNGFDLTSFPPEQRKKLSINEWKKQKGQTCDREELIECEYEFGEYTYEIIKKMVNINCDWQSVRTDSLNFDIAWPIVNRILNLHDGNVNDRKCMHFFHEKCGQTKERMVFFLYSQSIINYC